MGLKMGNSLPMAATVTMEDLRPRADNVDVVTLTPREMLAAMRDTQSRGVGGAAIFDFLHLIAAKKAGAARLSTLNTRHFQAFHRRGDPEIIHP